eukprot:TRINITY_DN300_c3_g1_i1.p1 TRINITY_DN300_c3_g1~~TRINITY_DN300_c3_g1_i1.p1  ORF type:complete len:337 (+),score=54.67 TRINITY_DN300_c3_g1_i1:77-1087(+)
MCSGKKPTMSHDEKIDSFMEATCTTKDTAERCLERSSGDLHLSVERYFNADAQYAKWDAPVPLCEKSQIGSKRAREPETVPTTQPVEKKPKRTGEGEKMPWEEIASDPNLANADCFEYNAVKSKLVQSNYQGPKDGSTWLWYLIGEMSVYPDEGTGSKSASVHLKGDKFQAGWLSAPSEPIPHGVIENRKNTMVDSVMQDQVNSYGKARRGCQPGYRHRWTYSDSAWELKGKTVKKGAATSCCSWDEQKEEDRWTVNVHMMWQAQEALTEGIFLVVADQRAEKMNKNQYQTSMSGKKWYLGSVNDAPEKIAAAKNRILGTLLPPSFKPKVVKPKKI